MGIPERKEREKEHRRQEIIDAAEKIFFEKGYEIATVDEIADMAELSKGTIYLYFKGKEDLLYEVFSRGMDILTVMLQKCNEKAITGYEKLLEMGFTFIRFSKEYENYFNLFPYCHGGLHHDLSIDEAEYKKQIMEDSPLPVVTKCVELGIKDGSVRDDIPVNQLASTLWAQMLGIIVIANQKADIINYYDVSVEEIFKTHLEIVSNGCKSDEHKKR